MLKPRQLVMGALLLSGAVMAQTPDPGQTQDPAPAPPTAQPGPEGSVDLRAPAQSDLTFDEMTSAGEQYRERMGVTAVRIEALVEEARKDKDIIRINCLVDKLVQVRAHLNVAETAMTTMREAIARNDQGAAFHEYTRLTIVNQSVQVLGAEADTCVGEDLSYVGATQVEVDVEGVPEGDPTLPGAPDTPEILRPARATPYI